MHDDKPLQSPAQLLAELAYPQQPNYLLAAMQDFYRTFGILSDESRVLLTDHFRADADLWQSLSPLFPEQTTAAHTLQVCRGAVCGQRLDISGLQSSDLAVVERCCMGQCQSSPVARLDDTLITDASIETINAAIRRLT